MPQHPPSWWVLYAVKYILCMPHKDAVRPHSVEWHIPDYTEGSCCTQELGRVLTKVRNTAVLHAAASCNIGSRVVYLHLPFITPLSSEAKGGDKLVFLGNSTTTVDRVVAKTLLPSETVRFLSPDEFVYWERDCTPSCMNLRGVGVGNPPIFATQSSLSNALVMRLLPHKMFVNFKTLFSQNLLRTLLPHCMFNGCTEIVGLYFVASITCHQLLISVFVSVGDTDETREFCQASGFHMATSGGAEILVEGNK